MKWVVIALTALSALLGYAWQSERAAHASTQAKAAQKMAHLDQQARQLEARNRTVEKELSDATIEHAARVDRLLDQSRRAALRSAGDSQRLLRDARAFAASQGCGVAAAAADIAPEPSAAMVLADLLGRADARATELAQTADDARIRGLACETDYDRAQRVKD